MNYYCENVSFIWTLCVFFLTFNINAQSAEDLSIHAIMSMSTDLRTHSHEATQFDRSDTSFLSLLLRLGTDTIHVVDTLNFDYRLNNTMRSIVHHKQHKFFVLVEKDMYDYYRPSFPESNLISNSEYFTVFDYSNSPFVIRKLKTDSLVPFSGAAGPSLASYEINGEYYWPYTLDETYYLLSKKMDVSFRLKDYDRMRDYYVENMPGYSTLRSYTYVFNPNEGCILERNSFLKWQEWGCFNDFDYPIEKEDGSKHKSFKIYFHTDKSKYTIGKKSHEKKKYFIRNNRTLQWDTLILPGNQFSVYAEDFLYGTLSSRSYYKKVPGFNIEVNKDVATRYTRKYSSYPELSTLTGVFFIYHIPSKKCIYYKGKDIDTELLALRDGWAYFRVYDTIKKIKFNEKYLSFDYESEVNLAHDQNFVPNVHHIFFAPKNKTIIEHSTLK